MVMSKALNSPISKMRELDQRGQVIPRGHTVVTGTVGSYSCFSEEFPKTEVLMGGFQHLKGAVLGHRLEGKTSVPS